MRAVYPLGYRSDITFMGLFPTAIPKGEPVIGVAAVGFVEHTFTNILSGIYYLLACEVRFGAHPLKALSQNYRAKARLSGRLFPVARAAGASARIEDRKSVV